MPRRDCPAAHLAVIAAGAVLNDNEALAEWALRKAGGRLPDVHRLIDSTGKKPSRKYEAFLARCG